MCENLGGGKQGLRNGGIRMARFKEERLLKVSSMCGKDYWDLLPIIRMRGKWVQDLGFQIGARILVQCESGKLTITLADEVIDDAAVVRV